jgi:DNA repair exonuclease SbcCD nuclease subunit
MSFTFIHTADWQIGKPFGGFEPDKAAVLRQARLDVLDTLATVARETGARHVLVAGDVFDSETAPDTLIRQTLARLASHRSTYWHLLPGNHDPARPGGVWEAAQRSEPAPNVHLHTQCAPAQIAPNVVLLPAPLQSKATSNDPTLWMGDVSSAPDALRIGLAHGSIRGFGSLGEAAVPIAPDRAARAGLAYLALGDWHGMKQIGPRVYYSGTPEPDSFADNEPGFALVVRIDAPDAPPRVARVPTARFVWSRRALRIDEAEDLAPFESEVRDLGAAAGHRLVELELEGDLTVGGAAALESRLERLSALLFHLRVDAKRLGLRAVESDLAALPEGPLRVVAVRLQETARGNSAEARKAVLALRKLIALAGRTPEAAP